MSLHAVAPFTGKRILLAGASRGLGRAAAVRLAASGARLALGARDGAALKQLHLALPAPDRHFHAAADLSTEQGARAWAAAAQAALGGIDALIVTATAGRPTRDEADFAASFQTDLMLPLRLFAACRDGLAATRGAAVFCSSRTARSPVPQTMAYGAAKAALEYAVACLAAENAAQGIRVNAIAPGSTRLDGGFWARCETEDPALWQRTLAGLPAGRLGTADDILPPLLFLCSDAAQWITGQTILVDGGQMLAPFAPPKPQER